MAAGTVVVAAAGNSDIDVARAQAAKEAAEAQLVAARGEANEHATQLLAQAALDRAELRLRAASK